jgi:hypothetical protein
MWYVSTADEAWTAEKSCTASSETINDMGEDSTNWKEMEPTMHKVDRTPMHLSGGVGVAVRISSEAEAEVVQNDLHECN